MTKGEGKTEYYQETKGTYIVNRLRNSNKRFKKIKTHVLYNETQLGLPQIICNSNIQECENYGLIQTNYVLGIDVLGRGLSGKP